jgi:hypothetical protein
MEQFLDPLGIEARSAAVSRPSTETLRKYIGAAVSVVKTKSSGFENRDASECFANSRASSGASSIHRSPARVFSVAGSSAVARDN